MRGAAPGFTRRHLLTFATVSALFFIAGCASKTRANGPNDAEGSAFWQGRLSVRIASTPVQSFSAGFELSGNAQAGELLLLTPLGSTYASLQWKPQSARLQAPGQDRSSESLEALVQQVTGTDLPIAALFAWLAGDARTAPGWEADLSDLATGKLSAKRISPEPQAELRVVLDR
jgi:outer membrane lipoprotein LolB